MIPGGDDGSPVWHAPEPRPLAEQPETGHNRWHPHIPPMVRCAPGDEVVLQTRDALDGQITADSTVEDVAGVNLAGVCPVQRRG